MNRTTLHVTPKYSVFGLCLLSNYFWVYYFKYIKYGAFIWTIRSYFWFDIHYGCCRVFRSRIRELKRILNYTSSAVSFARCIISHEFSILFYEFLYKTPIPPIRFWLKLLSHHNFYALRNEFSSFFSVFQKIACTYFCVKLESIVCYLSNCPKFS